ncbi:MAG: hypothetical protein EOO27_04530 [Comamonadaceae bacterium]|nr:MAG: hypothetical protein EOO27_04530 [Comamonadaceae bacterium]
MSECWSGEAPVCAQDYGCPDTSLGTGSWGRIARGFRRSSARRCGHRPVDGGHPTFNRPGDAVGALRAFASDPLVAAAVDSVLMVDQGTRQVVDEPGFVAAVTALGEKVQLFRQGNLGGSGGYSRIMYEALARIDSPYMLFMDDDIARERPTTDQAIGTGFRALTPA